MEKKKEKNKKRKIYYGYLIIGLVLEILFFITAYLVKKDFFASINDSFHNFILNTFLSETSDSVFKVITFFGSTEFILPFAVCLILFFFFRKKYGKSVSTAGVICASTAYSIVMKLLIKEARPAYMPVGMETSYAFPSGHTMGSTAIYGFLIYLLLKSNFQKKYKVFYTVLLSLLILGVMTSRIYLGAHYFNDILGGFLATSGIIFIFIFIDKTFDFMNFVDKFVKEKIFKKA